MDFVNFISNLPPAYIEHEYQKFLENPQETEPLLRVFLEGYKLGQDSDALPNETSSSIEKEQIIKEFNILNLIFAYRNRGHLFTLTNPVRIRRTYTPTLDLENFDLSDSDLNKKFKAGNQLGLENSNLSEILNMLKLTYCHTIGVEFMYIRKPEIVNWLLKRMENVRNIPSFTKDEKIEIFKDLSQGVLFEKFIHKKFPGQKSFSLEGGESLIPAMNALTEKASQLGYKEFIIGMAHRGRLNILANILNKPLDDIFSSFAGKEFEDEMLIGDVKYHLGYTTNRKSKNGEEIKLSLVPNPSHLEAVAPIVEGLSRAKIDADYKENYNKLLPILIHGDAAISGQGIVYEILQMSELEGYKTGGTIHIVINNQIGFTTNYIDGRSSTYSTDVAKVTQCPVFHVNGDDVEALVYTMQLAMDFRNTFNKDVFIDLLCYRKYGHNEGDEPRFTQPVLYKIIQNHPDPREIYLKKLLEENVLTKTDADKEESNFNTLLSNKFDNAKNIEKTILTSFLSERWKNFIRPSEKDIFSKPNTSIEYKKLLELTEKITDLPENKKFISKVIKLQEERKKLIFDESKIDWAMGELLAYASLVDEGFPVRMSGQDVQRGTFSHRHAVATVEDSDEKYNMLDTVRNNNAGFSIYNSPLSEYGVLGFDYGYSLLQPNDLTIWEAQFGDFFNGAQIIIDQFIVSAEDKWNLNSGLVMLLPHGFEGQGSEHSSARIERFLILCAENNIQVLNCSTPANFFHSIRRQIHRNFRKPLIIFTPKSLLRHPLCVSSIDELTNGGFCEIIIEEPIDKNKIKKIVFCTGKIYYDLIEYRRKTNEGKDILFVRIEQLYPFPRIEIEKLLNQYKHITTSYYWVQEEPKNMGAWNYIKMHFAEWNISLLGSRHESGCPASGSSKVHKAQQEMLLEKTFGKCSCKDALTECNMHCVEKY